jgi:hypothetical protein
MLSIVNPIPCNNTEHLTSFFNSICKERPQETRAEGVVLRDPTAWYYQPSSFHTKRVCDVRFQPLTNSVIR